MVFGLIKILSVNMDIKKQSDQKGKKNGCLDICKMNFKNLINFISVLFLKILFSHKNSRLLKTNLFNVLS